MGNYDTAPFGMKLSWVHRVRWHEIHWYLTVFACRPDKRPWGLVCPFPDRDRSSLSCVIRVFFHQLTAGIRAQNAESLYRRFLSREKRQFCLLMKYGGSFIRLCWRLPWHLIPLASMLSVWFGVFSKSYQVFLTLEEKTRPSGECEILFEDPLRTSLSNKTKQGASVVTNRIAFFKDESLWFSHEV